MQHEQRERQQQRQVNRAAGHHGVVTVLSVFRCLLALDSPSPASLSLSP
jgi:hypothetical protein